MPVSYTHLEQDEADGEEHLFVKARRVGHFRNNCRRQKTDGVEGKGEINRTSRYEADRHGFTDGAAGAEYDGSNNA